MYMFKADFEDAEKGMQVISALETLAAPSLDSIVSMVRRFWGPVGSLRLLGRETPHSYRSAWVSLTGGGVMVFAAGVGPLQTLGLVEEWASGRVVPGRVMPSLEDWAARHRRELLDMLARVAGGRIYAHSGAGLDWSGVLRTELAASLRGPPGSEPVTLTTYGAPRGFRVVPGARPDWLVERRLLSEVDPVPYLPLASVRDAILPGAATLLTNMVNDPGVSSGIRRAVSLAVVALFPDLPPENLMGWVHPTRGVLIGGARNLQIDDELMSPAAVTHTLAEWFAGAPGFINPHSDLSYLLALGGAIDAIGAGRVFIPDGFEPPVAVPVGMLKALDRAAVGVAGAGDVVLCGLPGVGGAGEESEGEPWVVRGVHNFTIALEGLTMAESVAKVGPALLARPVNAGAGTFYVVWRGQNVLRCPSFSVARTLARRINLLGRWLAKADGVRVASLVVALNDFIVMAGSSPSDYNPPLHIE